MAAGVYFDNHSTGCIDFHRLALALSAHTRVRKRGSLVYVNSLLRRIQQRPATTSNDQRRVLAFTLAKDVKGCRRSFALLFQAHASQRPEGQDHENRLALPVTAQDYGSESAQPLLLRVKEAAALMRIGRDTTYALVTQGRIPSVKLGKQIRIPRAALLDHLEKEASRALVGEKAAG
jgi:excisionase family DNA binding protein